MSRAPSPDVVVLAAGDPLPDADREAVGAALDGATLTIAADGGVLHAHGLDRDVDVLIGDLDSVPVAALARARASGTQVITHPVDKDATDLELALALVAGAAGARDDGDGERVLPLPDRPDVWVVGGYGGRADHLVGHLLLLTAPRFAGLHLHARWGVATVDVVRGSATVHGRAGDTVSLLALHGAADGVSTQGLRFPLTDARLAAGTSLGVSNRMLTDTATVHVTDGVVAVIRPGRP